MTEHDDRQGKGLDALLMTTHDDGEASMVRQILNNHGIPCQVVSDVPHTVLPITMDGLGEVRILVPAGLLDDANSLLAEHRREGLKIVRAAESETEPSEEEDPESA